MAKSLLQQAANRFFTMRSSRTKFPLVYIVFAVCFALLLVRLWISGLDTSIRTLARQNRTVQASLLPDRISKTAQNETLGFEKIFYISMPQYSPNLFRAKHIKRRSS